MNLSPVSQTRDEEIRIKNACGTRTDGISDWKLGGAHARRRSLSRGGWRNGNGASALNRTRAPAIDHTSPHHRAKCTSQFYHFILSGDQKTSSTCIVNGASLTSIGHRGSRRPPRNRQGRRDHDPEGQVDRPRLQGTSFFSLSFFTLPFGLHRFIVVRRQPATARHAPRVMQSGVARGPHSLTRPKLMACRKSSASSRSCKTASYRRQVPRARWQGRKRAVAVGQDGASG